MVFDECPELPASREKLQESLELTTRWARRCKEARKTDQALFGIVQEVVNWICVAKAWNR